MASWRPIAFGLVLALSWSAHGAARAEPEPAELPEVVAEGRSPPPQPGGADAKDTPSFSTAVEPRRGETVRTPELVASAPGVTVRDFGLNQPVTVGLRGSSSDEVVVLLDGLPLNAAAGGGTDLSALPASFIERIIVSRGAIGARYGSGALGGAVSIETRRPAPGGGPQLFGELTYGSFGTTEGSLAASAAVGKRASVFAALFAHQSDGDFVYPYDEQPTLAGNSPRLLRRENNEAQRAALLTRVLYEPGERRQLELLLMGDYGDRGLPGVVQAPTPDARQRDARGLGLARLALPIGESVLELRGGGRVSRLEWHVRDGDAQPPQYDRHALFDAALQRLWGRHALEAGASLARQSVSSAWHGENARTLLAAWAADEITFSRLSLVPVLRAERVGDETGASAKLGAQVPLSGWLDVKGNVGRSFRAPSLGELYLDQGLLAPNPDLRSERALYGDLGLQARGGPCAASAALYYTLYEDLILYELYAPMRAKPFNFGLAEVWGAEAEIAARAAGVASGELDVSTSYTLGFSANRLDDARYFGRELPYHPRHRAHARAELGWRRASVHAQLGAQTAQYRNRTNTVAADARARADVGAAVLIVPDAGVWLHADLKNLLDSADEDLFGYPLPGRALYLSLRLDTSHHRSNP